jgi:hypothetical protein
VHSICARRRQQKVPRDNIQPPEKRLIFSMHAEEQGRASCSFYGNNFYTLLSSESVYNVVYRCTCATFLFYGYGMENSQEAHKPKFISIERLKIIINSLLYGSH